ncbi:cuticle protein 18.7-like [Schistocerca piceifrons]|uniref:cuticle protein 18.7-like n=1 Tax=Schistocerca piceifrons TaxID=274613 RepID=UPI001F5F8602|nr:cuticle protein 18.7-like [Schistocerca piceifrons]XP_049780179.1 cuticle protein 18.7-like [Schistocerca cancellata]
MAKLLVVLSALVAVAVARPGFLHGALPYSAIHAPIAYAAAPVALTSQYHAQDELGQYSYGYHGGLSAKSEARAFDGSVAGGYSYVDEKGELQSVRYTADAVNGFRVAASNLPVAPAAPEAPALEAPKPVEDTPEVAEAKAAHAAAVADAAARAAAAPEEPEPAPVAVPAAPAVIPAAPAATIAYSAPAVVAVNPAKSFAYSTVAAAPIGHLAPISYGYHAVAAAPAISYSVGAAAPVAIAAAPAEANIVINDKGVPEYTPEVAAARAADAIAHLQAKARIFG